MTKLILFFPSFMSLLKDFSPEDSQKLDLTLRKLTPSRARNKYFAKYYKYFMHQPVRDMDRLPFLLYFSSLKIKDILKCIFYIYLPSISFSNLGLNAIFSKNKKSSIKGPIVWRDELLLDLLETDTSSFSTKDKSETESFGLSFLSSKLS